MKMSEKISILRSQVELSDAKILLHQLLSSPSSNLPSSDLSVIADVLSKLDTSMNFISSLNLKF